MTRVPCRIFGGASHYLPQTTAGHSSDLGRGQTATDDMLRRGTCQQRSRRAGLLRLELPCGTVE